MYQWALAQMNEVLNKQPLFKLDVLHNLGLLYVNQGRLVEGKLYMKKYWKDI